MMEIVMDRTRDEIATVYCSLMTDNEDICSFLHYLDQWNEFYIKNREEFESHADNLTFTCECGGVVTANTLYRDIKYYSSNPEPTVNDLSIMYSLLKLVNDGMEITDIVSSSTCLKCYKQHQIYHVKQKAVQGKLRKRMVSVN